MGIKKMAVCPGKTHSQITKMRNLDFVTSPIPGAGHSFFHGEAYSTPAVPYFLRRVRGSIVFGNRDPSRHLHRSALLRHPVAHTHTALLTGHLSESAGHWPAISHAVKAGAATPTHHCFILRPRNCSIITHHIVATAKSTSHRLKLPPARPSHWAAPITVRASHCEALIPGRSGHLRTPTPAGTHLPHHSAMCPLVPPVELYEFPHFFSAFLHPVDDFAHFLPVVGLIGLG